MISHVKLLEHILRMWNPKKQHFEVGAHIVTVEVEDIYFLTILSKHGAPISLTGSQGVDITKQELIVRHTIQALKCLGRRYQLRK